MTCIEAEAYVSVLYDGEVVPFEAANHIGDCTVCHQRLRSYSNMGAEIRLMASRTTPVTLIAPELLRKLPKRARLAFLKGRVVMPRVAFAAIALICLAVLSASWTIAHAQSKPLWFQFELRPELSQAGGGDFAAAQAGYKNQMGWLFAPDTRIAARVSIDSVEDGKVVVEVGARNLAPGSALSGPELLQNFRTIKMRQIIYTPGETMIIPIEGGGNLTLRGEVMDHQPQIASGYPLEPSPRQLILRNPVLIEGDQVIANSQGGTSMADGSSTVSVDAPDFGRFVFGLQEFPGSVKGEAKWGYLKFRIGDKNYTLTSEAAICGGDQPHTVWVAFMPKSDSR